MKYLSLLLLLATVLALSVSVGCVASPDNCENKTITVIYAAGCEVVIPADP